MKQTMKQKHTPGPWFVFGNGHCVGGPVDPGQGLCDDPAQTTAGVAMCAMRLRHNEECEANARLIKEAPELLTQLEAALHFVKQAKVPGPAMSDPWGPPLERIREMEAVIKRAKGEGVG